MDNSMRVVTEVVAPTLGAVLANLLFLGPMPAVRAARRAKSLGPVNAMLFPFILSNCLGYASYGFLKKDPFILLANISGVFLGLFYLLTSYRLCENEARAARLEALTMSLVVFWGVLNSVVAFIPNTATREGIIGYAALVMTLLMFAAPLSTIRSVLQERNTISIDKGFLVMQVLSCVMWSTYGFVLLDYSILIGNTVGLVLGLAQVGLVAMLPRYMPGAALPAKSEPATFGSDSFDDLEGGRPPVTASSFAALPSAINVPELSTVSPQVPVQPVPAQRVMLASTIPIAPVTPQPASDVSSPMAPILQDAPMAVHPEFMSDERELASLLPPAPVVPSDVDLI